jgi:hypothetical protein
MPTKYVVALVTKGDKTEKVHQIFTSDNVDQQIMHWLISLRNHYDTSELISASSQSFSLSVTKNHAP